MVEEDPVVVEEETPLFESGGPVDGPAPLCRTGRARPSTRSRRPTAATDEARAGVLRGPGPFLPPAPISYRGVDAPFLLPAIRHRGVRDAAFLLPAR